MLVGYQEKVFFEVKVVDHAQHVKLLRVAARVDVVQELDFVKGLIKVVLVVFDDFQAHRVRVFLVFRG